MGKFCRVKPTSMDCKKKKGLLVVSTGLVTKVEIAFHLRDYLFEIGLAMT